MRITLLREWGFPIGLLTLWILVAAYTVHDLAGTRSALQSAAPQSAAPESTEMPTMVGQPVAIEAQVFGHQS
jgi:hypothetical protein